MIAAYDTLKPLPPRENVTEKYKREKEALAADFQKHLDEWQQTAVMVVNLAKKYGDREQLHHKVYGTWETYTWNQVSEAMYAVAGALLAGGFKEEEKTGIFSPNRAEWHLSDLGTQLIRGITVPIYATNTEKEAQYIIDDAEIRVLFVGRQVHYDKTYALLDKCPSLEKIVVFHRGTKIHDDKRVVMWDDFLDEGRKAGKKDAIEEIMKRAHYEDICTIIYTSGTTGDPKGAVHPHRSLMQNSWGVGRYSQVGFDDTGSTLSMLPLTHVLERSWEYGIFSMGMQIWYCEDHNEILEYMLEANTAVMNSAPRLFEKIYSTVYTKLKDAPKAKQNLFHWAVSVGKAHGDMVLAGKQPGLGLRLKRKLAGKLVLDKIKGLFGKNMHHVNYGGAALNPEIEKFFFYCGMLVLGGYGLTETSPVISINGPGGFKFGTIGPLSPLIEVRIDKDSGEIQSKGPNLFKEYYKKPEQTKEAFTSDGWFKTGDVGKFDDDGYLIITDRLKDLIITSGGKNIAPQMIELIMGESLFIEYIAVVGDAKPYISALVVPSFENLEDWANKNKVSFSSRADLISKPEVIEFYKNIIEERQKDMGQVEKIKKFTLLEKEFSQETGEITPTMKVKRKVVQEKYKEQIDLMYSN